MKRRTAREEADLLDFGPSPRRETLPRRVVERLADLFEPRLTPEELTKLRSRGGR